MKKPNEGNTPSTHLNKFWVILIFIYYFLLFILGTVGSFILLNLKRFLDYELSHFTIALCGSIAMGLVGSTTFYIRKLYKSCINIYSKKSPNASSVNSFILIGTIFYYFTRPLFSIGFAILIVLGFLSGLFTISATKIELGQGLVYITMVLSYFCGFLSGQFIKRLEIRGKQIIKTIFKEKGNGD